MPTVESPDHRYACLLIRNARLTDQHRRLLAKVLKLEPGEEKSALTVKLVKLYVEIDQVRRGIAEEMGQRAPQK